MGWFSDIWDSVKNAWDKVRDVVGDAFKDLGNILITVGTGGANIFTKLGASAAAEALKPAFELLGFTDQNVTSGQVSLIPQFNKEVAFERVEDFFVRDALLDQDYGDHLVNIVTSGVCAKEKQVYDYCKANYKHGLPEVVISDTDRMVLSVEILNLYNTKIAPMLGNPTVTTNPPIKVDYFLVSTVSAQVAFEEYASLTYGYNSETDEYTTGGVTYKVTKVEALVSPNPAPPTGFYTAQVTRENVADGVVSTFTKDFPTIGGNHFIALYEFVNVNYAPSFNTAGMLYTSYAPITGDTQQISSDFLKIYPVFIAREKAAWITDQNTVDTAKAIGMDLEVIKTSIEGPEDAPNPDISKLQTVAMSYCVPCNSEFEGAKQYIRLFAEEMFIFNPRSEKDYLNGGRGEIIGVTAYYRRAYTTGVNNNETHHPMQKYVTLKFSGGGANVVTNNPAVTNAVTIFNDFLNIRNSDFTPPYSGNTYSFTYIGTTSITFDGAVYSASDKAASGALSHFKDTIKSAQDASGTAFKLGSIAIKEQDFSSVYVYKYIFKDLIVETPKPEGTVEITYDSDATLIIKRWHSHGLAYADDGNNTTTCEQLKLYDFGGLHYIPILGIHEVHIAPLDYSLGSLCFPLSQTVLDQMDLLEREEVVAHSRYLFMYSGEYTHLEYYETPKFIKFASAVITFVTIVMSAGAAATAVSALQAEIAKQGMQVAIREVVLKIALTKLIAYAIEEAMILVGKDNTALLMVLGALKGVATGYVWGGASFISGTSESIFSMTDAVFKGFTDSIEFKAAMQQQDQDALMAPLTEAAKALEDLKEANASILERPLQDLVEEYSRLSLTTFETPEDYGDRMRLDTTDYLRSIEQLYDT